VLNRNKFMSVAFGLTHRSNKCHFKFLAKHFSVP
jgi:hypothetical protein